MSPKKTDVPQRLDFLETQVEGLVKEVEKIAVIDENVAEMRRFQEKMWAEIKSQLSGEIPKATPRDKGKGLADVTGEGGGSTIAQPQQSGPSEIVTALALEPRAASEPTNRKMELPVFDGNNAESWVVRIYQFFELGGHTEAEKLDSVKVCFDEEALMWFRWEKARNPFSSWEDLKRRLLENFSPTQSDPCERIMTLRQTGTVREYNREFIFLATNNQSLSEKVLETAYMIGLSPEIRVSVKLHEPKSLEKRMSLALGVEECFSIVAEHSTTRSSHFSTLPSRSLMQNRTQERERGHVDKGEYSRQAGAISSKHNLSHMGNNTRSFGSEKHNPNFSSLSQKGKMTPFRHLTPEEQRDRKARGLCFKCDERYTRDHKCQLQALQVYLVQEDGSEEKWNEGEETVEVEPEEEVTELAELSIRSVVGLSSPRTMKIRGSVKGRDVVILIDCGASHNFISEALVKELSLITERTTGYGVVMGTGITVRGEGICKKMLVKVQNLELMADFLPLELGSADIILGMMWLEPVEEEKQSNEDKGVNAHQVFDKRSREGKQITGTRKNKGFTKFTRAKYKCGIVNPIDFQILKNMSKSTKFEEDVKHGASEISKIELSLSKGKTYVCGEEEWYRLTETNLNDVDVKDYASCLLEKSRGRRRKRKKKKWKSLHFEGHVKKPLICEEIKSGLYDMEGEEMSQKEKEKQTCVTRLNTCQVFGEKSKRKRIIPVLKYKRECIHPNTYVYQVVCGKLMSLALTYRKKFTKPKWFTYKAGKVKTMSTPIQKKINKDGTRSEEEKLGAKVNKDTHLVVVKRPWKCQRGRKRKKIKDGKIRKCKYKPGKWDQLELQSHTKREIKSQSRRRMKGCKRVKSCCVALDSLLLWEFQVKKNRLHMGNKVNCYHCDDGLRSISQLPRKKTFSKKWRKRIKFKEKVKNKPMKDTQLHSLHKQGFSDQRRRKKEFYDTFISFNYNGKCLHMENLLRSLKKIKFRGHKTLIVSGLQGLVVTDMTTAQMTDIIGSLRLPKKSLEPKMKMISWVVLFLEEHDYHTHTHQVILDMLIAAVGTMKEMTYWTSRKRRRCQHKHKKKVMRFLTFCKKREVVEHVFRLKKRTRLKREGKLTKANDCLFALICVKLLWGLMTVDKKQTLTSGKRDKFRKGHRKRKTCVVKVAQKINFFLCPNRIPGKRFVLDATKIRLVKSTAWKLFPKYLEKKARLGKELIDTAYIEGIYALSFGKEVVTAATQDKSCRGANNKIQWPMLGVEKIFEVVVKALKGRSGETVALVLTAGFMRELKMMGDNSSPDIAAEMEVSAKPKQHRLAKTSLRTSLIKWAG